MANILTRDGAGDERYLKAVGAGTNDDPHVVVHITEAIAAGASPDLGATTDAEAPGNGSVIGLLKRVRTLLGDLINTVNGTLSVDDAGGSLTVDGEVAVSNFPATQPVQVIDGAHLSFGAKADAAAADDAGAYSLISLFKRLLQKLTTGLTVLASENHIGSVAGRGTKVSNSFARPADVAVYLARDVVSNSTVATALMEFANLARVPGGNGYLVKARLSTNLSTTTARFRLWLYDLSNPTVVADNQPMELKYINRANRIGYIDFPALSTEAGASDCAEALNQEVRLHFVCAANSRHLYGLLETLDGFAPANGQTFEVTLSAELN